MAGGSDGRGAGAGVRSASEKESEIETETESKTEAETETEVGAETEVHAEAGAGSGPVSAAEAEGDTESGSGADAESGAEADAEAGAESESGADVAGGGAAEAEGDGSDGMTVRDAISAPDAQGEPRRTTRRFPLFTRDTARPEGGGRAASGDAPAPARQWPILTVLSAVALGLLLTALDVFRVGTILIGAALLAGAVMRWMLPSVGMLAVRSRFTDMLTYSVLGVAIVVLALMAQPQPLLEIPFLDDTLHFTVR